MTAPIRSSPISATRTTSSNATSAPDFKNKSWTIAAEVTVPQGGANGCWRRWAAATAAALLLQDGKPEFAYAYSNQPEHKFRAISDQPLAPGNHILRVKFEYSGRGIGKAANATLLVDEKPAAQGRIERTVPDRFSLDETFDVGEDTGTPVLEEYADKMPFRFTGTLKRFVVVLGPLKLSANEQRRLHEELAKAMAAVRSNNQYKDSGSPTEGPGPTAETHDRDPAGSITDDNRLARRWPVRFQPQFLFPR